MNTLLLSLILAFGAGQPVDQQDEARTLFREGTVKYESADYNGAIESFTEALALVTDDHVRLSLLFNIAKAHEKAFKIDRDVTHLRQALTLYRRYLEFAQSTGDLGEELDVATNIARLEKQIRIHNQVEDNRARAEGPQVPPPPPPPPPIDGSTNWKKARNTGVGLVVSGGAATIGGVVLLTLGSTFEGSAQDQVNSLADEGVPPDHPAWEEGEDFIASERRRGAIFMGVGGSVAVVGAVGVGVGSYYLVKSKRLREGSVSATPTFAPGFAGVQISGKF